MNFCHPKLQSELTQATNIHQDESRETIDVSD